MHINPNIEKPIFIQIAEQLEDSIFTKVFPEETKIPSTNELSSLLNINPHTAELMKSWQSNSRYAFSKVSFGLHDT